MPPRMKFGRKPGRISENVRYRIYPIEACGNFGIHVNQKTIPSPSTHLNCTSVTGGALICRRYRYSYLSGMLSRRTISRGPADNMRKRVTPSERNSTFDIGRVSRGSDALTFERQITGVGKITSLRKPSPKRANVNSPRPNAVF